MARIVYSPNYNIKFYGLEKIHPFDSRKYGRAWRLIEGQLGDSLQRIHVRPQRQANLRELRRVHSRDYLQKLSDTNYLAQAHNLAVLSKLPGFVTDWHILRPMRWATRGTIDAAEQALQQGLAINLSGGYHHAAPNQGEGFSIYADVGIAIASLRSSGLLSPNSKVVYIDTDAHQGNGVCRTFMHDPRIAIFDIFNSHLPPADRLARERIDCQIPVNYATSDEEYMDELECRLPGFLESVSTSEVGIAFYNAGTDVRAKDPMGFMNLSAKAILKRDLYVVSELRRRGIPTVMVPSGGFTKESYQLIGNSVVELIKSEIHARTKRPSRRVHADALVK